MKAQRLARHQTQMTAAQDPSCRYTAPIQFLNVLVLMDSRPRRDTLTLEGIWQGLRLGVCSSSANSTCPVGF